MSALKKMCGELSDEDFARNVMLEDLQLAAELGKTLLERNKELETALKQHHNIVEDQAQEIEYLTKQTVALREVNDSRLRIYEQLEVSIQDLERANHRLVLENSAEKKHIKSLNATIESLEGKCEELQSTIDDLRLQADVLKRRSQRSLEIKSPTTASGEIPNLKRVDKINDQNKDIGSSSILSDHQKQKENCDGLSTTEEHCLSQNCISAVLPENAASDTESESTNEQVSQLLGQLSKTRAQCARDERRIVELEEQLSTMVQQNQALEDQVVQLSHSDDLNLKSMHEELTTLEEVRQGQMCSRCLRTIKQNGSEIPDDDDSSMLEALMDSTSVQHSSFAMDVQDHFENQSSPIVNTKQATSNPYKELVEKYEALVEVHRKPRRPSRPENCASLQEELQMGDFNALSAKDTDSESGHGYVARKAKQQEGRKNFSTPTDFSEAETSSSGFADETSNKGTQTEDRVGSFLCTIADGEDCKFSIYDDANPIDPRFRDRPEYQDLFKEIFKVLKKAAENKEEGDDLPLLDDYTAVKLDSSVSSVTPLKDALPELLDDDTQSVLSSTISEISALNTEPINVIENIVQAQNQQIQETKTESEPILKPLIRPPLEYLSVEVRKRSASRRKSKHLDRSDSPVTHIIGSPKISYGRPNSGRRRRDKNQPIESDTTNWNGNSMQFYPSNRNVASPTPSQGSVKFEFRPSTASQDLNKLKKLDLSYAEVLRSSEPKKNLIKYRRK